MREPVAPPAVSEPAPRIPTLREETLRVTALSIAAIVVVDRLTIFLPSVAVALRRRAWM